MCDTVWRAQAVDRLSKVGLAHAGVHAKGHPGVPVTEDLHDPPGASVDTPSGPLVP